MNQSNYNVQTIIQLTPEQLDELFEKKLERVLDQFRTKEKEANLPPHMSRQEVADYFNVSQATVHGWEKRGLIERVILADSVIRYEKEQVLALKK